MTIRRRFRGETVVRPTQTLNRRFMLAALVALIAIRADGAESRVPVYQSGTVMTQGGSYYLSSSLAGGMPAAIQISGPASEARTLDLNGMTIDAPSAVAIDIDGAKNVVVRNGTVRGSIRIANAGSVELSDIVVEQGAITFMPGYTNSVLLENVRVSNGFIQLQNVRDGTLRDVRVLAGGAAMPAVAALGCERLVLERVAAYADSAYPPVMVEGGKHVQIRQCALQGDLVPGTGNGVPIELRNTRSPLVVDSQLAGVRLLMSTVDAQVEDNAIGGSTDGGVWIDSGVSRAIVRGNEITGSYSGVTIYGSRCVVRDNTIADSASWGIVVYGNGNTIVGNSISWSQSAGIQIGDGMIPATQNQVIGNTVAVSSGGLLLHASTTENAYRDNSIVSSGGIQDLGTNADMGGNLVAY